MRARVTFGSDTNLAHFAIDLSENSKRFRSVVVSDDGSVSAEVFEDERDEFMDLASRYGGEVLWVAEER